MKYTPQEMKVYTYIKDHPGATTHDITRDTFVQKPCARITDLRAKGAKIVSIGQKKYPGSRAFECYAVEEPLTRVVSSFEYDHERGCMVEKRQLVAI